MKKSKNILIAIDNGIIALDMKKQLYDAGYNAEIMNPATKENIEEALNEDFQLIILEKSNSKDDIECAARLTQDHKIPSIYISTDGEHEKFDHTEFRILMMPFNENELMEVVKIALAED